MIVWRYPYGKYDLATLDIMFTEFCACMQLKEGEAIALPDDISLEKMSEKELINIRNQIDNRIHEMFYKPKCQWEGDGPAPCDDSQDDCLTCDYYYSDDDKRWH